MFTLFNKFLITNCFFFIFNNIMLKYQENSFFVSIINKVESKIKNKTIRNFLIDKINLCKPIDVYFCNGSDIEYKKCCEELVKKKILKTIKKRNSYLALSDKRDVARVESKTFICSDNKDDVGPTNNWRESKEMKDTLYKLFDGCMKGRIMYVIPFSMGNIDSEFSKYGIQITDSLYVVVNMIIMTKISENIYDSNKEIIQCIHSIGCPLNENDIDEGWKCNPELTCIAHFPYDNTKSIWSFGSGYGGNALLGKKCLSLRIASVIGKEEGWLAEHMLILSITNPKGIKKYIAAAFPSACGKTNLAMIKSKLEGWSVKVIGDDIAWLKLNEKDGRLYAINPENGFFGVAPNTSYKTNPNAIDMLNDNILFTNTAYYDDDVWWETTCYKK